MGWIRLDSYLQECDDLQLPLCVGALAGRLIIRAKYQGIQWGSAPDINASLGGFAVIEFLRFSNTRNIVLVLTSPKLEMRTTLLNFLTARFCEAVVCPRSTMDNSRGMTGTKAIWVPWGRPLPTNRHTMLGRCAFQILVKWLLRIHRDGRGGWDHDWRQAAA